MSATDKSVTLGINFDSSSLTTGAESGAAALANLQEQIKGDTQALGQMQKAMRDLQGGTSVNIDQFRNLKAAIDQKKQSIADARSAYLALGGGFEKVRKSGGGFRQQLAELTKTASGMSGPLGEVANVVTRIGQSIANNPIRVGLVAIAAGLGILVAQTTSAIASLTQYAIAQADARRSELLRLEGLTKIRNWYGVAAGSARDLQDSIDKVSASSALSRDRIAGLAEQLYRAHFRGKNLDAALEAAAIKQSTQGSEQTSMWIGYAEAINRTGGDVRKFAQNVKNQLGGIAQKQMLSATVQAEKLQESYAALTTGIDVEEIDKARAAFNALFSQSTASGRALKQLLTLLIQPLVDAIAAKWPVIKRFFQGMILAGQDLVLAGLDIAEWAQDTFGKVLPDNLDLTDAALKTGQAAVWSLAVAFGALGLAALGAAGKITVDLTVALLGMTASIVKSAVPAVVSLTTTMWKQLVPAIVSASAAMKSMTVGELAAMITAFAKNGVAALAGFAYQLAALAIELVTTGAAAVVSFTTSLIAMLPAVWAQVTAFGALAAEVLIVTWPFLLAAAAVWGLYEIVTQLYALWQEIDWPALGKAVWEGITGAFTKIGDWFASIGTTISDGFRNALGIHSPSKVFEAFGQDIGEGLQLGIDSTAPDVNQSVEHLVDVPAAPTASTGAAGSGAPGAASALPSVTIQNINITAGGADGASMAQDFVTELTAALRTVGYQLGAAGGVAA